MTVDCDELAAVDGLAATDTTTVNLPTAAATRGAAAVSGGLNGGGAALAMARAAKAWPGWQTAPSRPQCAFRSWRAVPAVPAAAGGSVISGGEDPSWPTSPHPCWDWGEQAEVRGLAPPFPGGTWQ